MRKASLATALVMCLAAITSGCGMFNRVDYYSHKAVTAGRELVDLQEARDKRVISEPEFDKMKAKIIKSESDEKK